MDIVDIVDMDAGVTGYGLDWIGYAGLDIHPLLGLGHCPRASLKNGQACKITEFLFSEMEADNMILPLLFRTSDLYAVGLGEDDRHRYVGR